MDILFAFAPFIVFVLAERTIGVSAGLLLAAATSALLLLRDWIGKNRSVKVLEVGTLLLFAVLAAYATLVKPAWSIAAVRLRVDGGLLLIVLISLLIRRPFTLQYAREQAPREFWATPEFIRTNYVITAVWALAFAVMVVADVLMAYVSTLPHSVGIVVTVLAIAGAIRFTSSYPERGHTKISTQVP